MSASSCARRVGALTSAWSLSPMSASASTTGTRSRATPRTRTIERTNGFRERDDDGITAVLVALEVALTQAGSSMKDPQRGAIDRQAAGLAGVVVHAVRGRAVEREAVDAVARDRGRSRGTPPVGPVTPRPPGPSIRCSRRDLDDEGGRHRAPLAGAVVLDV